MHQTTLTHTQSRLNMINHWLGSTSIAVVLSLASLPASAQNQVWITQFGSGRSDYPLAAAPNGSGGVYVSGQTDGALGASNAGVYDAFVASFDSAGNQLWV